MRHILPPATIGIIGGGQLGMMMALEAKAMGYRIHSYDPNPEASIRCVSDYHVSRDFEDRDALMAFADSCAVLTYEFENVSHSLMYEVEARYNLPQKAKPLEMAGHRVKELEYAHSLAINIPKYTPIQCKEDLLKHGREIGFPIVFKTLSGGYDGHGQQRFYQVEDIMATKTVPEGIAQEYISFDCEVSVVCARGNDWIYCFDPIENQHENGILRTSLQPTYLSQHLQEQLKSHTKKMVESLDYIGTFAIEYFIKGEEIFFNEMACRPHNSGHCTIETYAKSQFKMHIEAICGLGNGSNQCLAFGVMVNVLGFEVEAAYQFLSSKHYDLAFYHDYLKTVKPNRKMGHMTFISESFQVAKENANELRRWMKPNE